MDIDTPWILLDTYLIHSDTSTLLLLNFLNLDIFGYSNDTSGYSILPDSKGSRTLSYGLSSDRTSLLNLIFSSQAALRLMTWR